MDTPNTPDLHARLSQALAGQYVIERLLGQGGMGSVFLARDVALDREVAIKVITPDLASSHELRQRFIQEARTVAKLRHPNIVTVYATGEAEGLLYFVMEFVPGESLRDRMTRDGAMAPHDGDDILRDLALALDHAHAAGIVHRDVKPENVLLDRETGRAMLTDFGVARALAAAGDGRLTGHGFVLGSPRYMSPEQAAGDQDLDGRSDQYSLGLIGYEMFAGVPAVDGPTTSSILIKHLTERPKPLSDVRPELPTSITITIDRALQKDPSTRFARCGAFAASLAGQTFDDATPSWQQGRTTKATPTAAPTRSRRVVIGGGAIALAAAAVAIVSTTRARPDERSWFVAPFEVQGPDRSLDWLREGSLNMLTLSLAQWTDLHVVEYERTLDLLRSAKLDSEKRIGLDDARKLAQRTGSGRVVMGQVTVLGDSMIVTASLYDAGTGKSTQKARVAALSKADPRPVFESVATALLKLVGAPGITIELAKQTTSSVVAYRHYLEGLRHLNSWRLRAADTAFSSAIAADSTFALAYYKKSLALGWEASNDTARLIAAEQAVRLAERLPLRTQELVKGHAELTAAFSAAEHGDTTRTKNGFLASRARLARLVATDSTDAEAWYALADADYHLVWNTSYGTSPDSTAKYLTESLRGFQRTIRLDSTFHLAFQHLVEMYGQAANPRSFLVLVGDTIKPGGRAEYERKIGTPEQLTKLRADAQRLSRDAAANWVTSDPDAGNARKALADAYLLQGQPDSAMQTLQQALRRPSTADPSIEWMLPLLKARALMPSSGAEMAAVVKRFPLEKARALPIGVRFQGMLGAFTVAGIVGMPSLLDSAGALLNKTDPFIPGPGKQSTAFITNWLATGMRIGMGVPMTPAMRESMANGVRTLDAQVKAGGDARTDVSIPYMVYLETGDTLFRATVQRWNPTRLIELDALDALSRGDTATALRIAKAFPSLDSLKKAAIGFNGMRMVARARVVAALGDLRLAASMYDAIDPAKFVVGSAPEVNWPIYIRSFLARARLNEQLGELAQARAAYERFATLWQGAEAPLQPQVRAAREAIARLRDASTAPKSPGS